MGSVIMLSWLMIVSPSFILMGGLSLSHPERSPHGMTKETIAYYR